MLTDDQVKSIVAETMEIAENILREEQSGLVGNEYMEPVSLDITSGPGNSVAVDTSGSVDMKAPAPRNSVAVDTSGSVNKSSAISSITDDSLKRPSFDVSSAGPMNSLAMASSVSIHKSPTLLSKSSSSVEMTPRIASTVPAGSAGVKRSTDSSPRSSAVRKSKSHVHQVLPDRPSVQQMQSPLQV